MASFAEQLKQMAFEIVQDMQMRASDRKKELAQLQQKIALIQAELDEASLANERFRNYTPEVGGDLYCPRCGVSREKPSVLSAIGGGNDKEDFFRCSECRQELGLLTK